MLEHAGCKKAWDDKNRQLSLAASVERYFCLVFLGYFFY